MCSPSSANRRAARRKPAGEGRSTGGLTPTPKTGNKDKGRPGDKKPDLDKLTVVNRSSYRGTVYVEESQEPPAASAGGEVRFLLEGFSQPRVVSASTGLAA